VEDGEGMVVLEDDDSGELDVRTSHRMRSLVSKYMQAEKNPSTALEERFERK